jgi:hypothetical protein
LSRIDACVSLVSTQVDAVFLDTGFPANQLPSTMEKLRCCESRPRS